MPAPRLKMLPISEYEGVNRDDPIRFYNAPVLGGPYRRRIELCLAELSRGERVLEIGFGSGVTFLNLHEQYKEIYGMDLTANVTEIQAFFEKKGISTNLCNGSVLEMPYQDKYFDSVLLISILEHLKSTDQVRAFEEIRRALKPGGQVVYGVPVERPLMVFLFRLLGYDIHEHHFSTEGDVVQAARSVLQEKRLVSYKGPWGIFGNLYEVGHFMK